MAVSLKKRTQVTYQLKKYSQVDSKIAGTTELFNSIEKKEINELLGWEVTKSVGDIDFTFGGNRLLTIQDQSVLLGILYLVGKPDQGDDKETHKNKCFVFPSDLDIKTDSLIGDAIEKRVGTRVVTFYEMLSASGMSDGGGKKNQLIGSLKRLSSVTIRYKNNKTKWDGADNFIAYDTTNDSKVVLYVNWRVAGAIFEDYHFIKVDLDERNLLAKEHERKLHLYLSSYVWTGRVKDIKLDTLVDKVWIPSDSSSSGTILNRRSKIKAALNNINKFKGWSIITEGRGTSAKAKIKRVAEPQK